MKTIKLPYKSDYNFIDLMRQYTILVKSCYKKILYGFTDKDIRLYVKTLNGIYDLDSRFVENAILDAKSLQKENKIVFNRTNFIKRTKNKIDHQTFKENKYLPIVNYGEKSQKGNRKFKIDIDNNKVIFKLNKNKHINIKLPIGNLKYEYFDPINASIEIARRGYLFNKMYIKNSFYPKFSLKDQWNQWKKEIDLFTEDWKDFYKHLKTLDMKYRVPIEGLVYKEECIKRIPFGIF